MPRPIKETSRDAMIIQIKNTAREQMSEKGTAGLSLRGIARELGVTAPAIYNYFPTLDDLITALIIDAFKSIATAMTEAANRYQDSTTAWRIYATALAYREWALANPIQFQLIYGNPIPNYRAPSEITGPMARLPFMGLMQDFNRAYENGELHLPDMIEDVPPSVKEHIQHYQADVQITIPAPLIMLIMASWAHIHGMVTLELFQHNLPILGDTTAFYEHEIRRFLHSMKMQLD
ncbi:MAG TPA: TetR/AcrR family transcriptional regulator [Aggregatilineales bacterium]|nr:TetR/AcrR family transcriptional regulator [Aggregatilineales bacterium]